MVLNRFGLAIAALVLALAMFTLSVFFKPREVETVTVMSSPKVTLTSPYLDILEDYRAQIERMALLKAIVSEIDGAVYSEGVVKVEESEELERILVVFRKETGRDPEIEDLGDSIRITDLGVVVVVKK